MCWGALPRRSSARSGPMVVASYSVDGSKAGRVPWDMVGTRGMMSSKPKTTTAAWPLAGRAIWAVIAAAHVPALVSSCERFAASGWDVAQLGGCVGLSLSIVLFGLKICDVAFLRLNANRRSLVASCIAMALIHGDVMGLDLGPTVLPECTAIVALGVGAAALPQCRRLFAAAAQSSPAVIERVCALSRLRDPAWLDAITRHSWVLCPRPFSLRAPPA